ncbi:MAG: class I SAM-dependent RNA methyltransferase [Acidobacteriota bacterium]
MTRRALELAITALAAGGDGVGRDDTGRVTFVPRTAPGDRVRVAVTEQHKSFARGELVDVIAASGDRVEPPCAHFREGCGGCQWQHVARPAQVAAKQALVTNALRKLGVAVEPVADPCPPYGWRRRARFHVMGGKVGLFQHASHRVLPIATCPQLEPELDAARAAVAASSPPDGELALVRGHRGEIVVGLARPWRLAARLVGRAGIVGVIAGDARHGQTVIELEPGLTGGPWDFAQASAAGNAALVQLARAAVGKGPGTLVELYAGSGNFTRAFVADGWEVLASDLTGPAGRVDGARFEVGPAPEVLARVTGPVDAVVLDPPRTGAADAVAGIVELAPRAIVYVSCDPATLARDAGRLVEAGYRAERAWPVDVMPQTSHVEIVMRLSRS